MTNMISKFQTISRHQAPLSQPAVVIECLTFVLNYIKEVLTDDATQTLYERIEHHIDTYDSSAHYNNLELLSNDMMAALRSAFVSIGVYSSQFSEYPQPAEYYDSRIPTDYKEFVVWLITHQAVYTDEIPVDYDAFRIGLTLGLVKEWFAAHHTDSADAHPVAITGRLNELTDIYPYQPVYWLTVDNFKVSVYNIIDLGYFDKLMVLVANQLIADGSPITVDYSSPVDSASVVLPVGYIDSPLSICLNSVYFNTRRRGALIFQLNNAAIKIYALEGPESFAGYSRFLADYGENGDVFIGRKYIDYYHNHLDYVIDASMSDQYKATLTAIRGNVNTNYCKVYNVYTVLRKHNFSIRLSCSIGKLAIDKTLDIVNLIGLSKSIACVCLVPYTGSLGKPLNKLVVSFDNYNPAFTATIADGIDGIYVEQFEMIISVSGEFLSVYTAVDGKYSIARFPNLGRMYDVDPFFLFVVPRLAEFERGTTRLTDLRLYSDALSEHDAVVMISGFNQ